MRDNFCLGTAQLGMAYGIANEDGQPDLEEARRIVQTADKNGIRYYDTAQSYGTSEQILGEAFAALPGREHIRCVTKLSPDFRSSTFEDLKTAIEDSLRRLGLGHLWGVILHRVEGIEDWPSLVQAVERCKAQGLIRYFGVSLYEPEEAVRFAREPYIDIIQVPFNVLDRRLIDNDFFPLAIAEGKHIFIRSVFLQGLMLMSESRIKRKRMGWAAEHLAGLHTFIQVNGVDQKTFIIKVVAQRVPEAVLVVGLESYEQLLENLALFDAPPVPEDLTQAWWDKLPRYPDKLLNPSLW